MDKLQTTTKTYTDAVTTADKNKDGAMIVLGTAAIAAVATIVKVVSETLKK